MQEQYERLEIVITAFDQEDVITTSGVTGNPEDGVYTDKDAPVVGRWG